MAVQYLLMYARISSVFGIFTALCCTDTAVSATIGVVQMFETRNRQLAFQRATDSLRVELRELEEQTELINLEAQ